MNLNPDGNLIINFPLLRRFEPLLIAASILLLAGTAEPGWAAQLEPSYKAELIFKPTLRFPRTHSASIAALPDGGLIAAWWNGSEEGGLDLVIRSARRLEGNDYWEEPRVVADTPDTTEGNPVLFPVSGNEIWLIYRSGLPFVKINLKKSRDGGRTWSAPEILVGEPGWSSRSRIIRLANGDIIIPIMKHEHSAFLYTSNEGKTWKRSKPVITPTRNNEPTVAQRRDGSLLCYMRCYDQKAEERFLWQAESFDNGRSWSEPSRTKIRNPSSAIELLALDNGHFVLVFNDTQTNRSSLCLALSLDEGRTWKYQRTLEDAPGRFSYPMLTQTPEGLIHVSYTFRRTSIKHVEVNEAWIMEEQLHPGETGGE
ncbi:MAG: hypothetical protein A3F83_01565 [Candidatus Glassbacteria bacterium RIFCSPLOWO2_12_FULL_58_11]|uniref:Sialidase domain-containing protein n=2 Tax=Candidatus Glassiibacteriota TaxID=1817805 RepID=A0A1F5YVI6_9BACT|nr:MAG: hypothetical protein A2Z86_07305 [Candidatus Glassbacteria bacterium GWA2_58_10]OGG04083.1 MAG: hypothetical protein A3F83_01565 [Candidatus Glassbacteria bacterium RIFCSPLOWO2_12_FULL_58_11]